MTEEGPGPPGIMTRTHVKGLVIQRDHNGLRQVRLLDQQYHPDFSDHRPLLPSSLGKLSDAGVACGV